MKNRSFLLPALLLTLVPLQLLAENWPQWRGGRLDSVSLESGLPDQIGKDNQLWRMELPGPGGASPVVWNDSIFVTSVGEDDALVLLHFSSNGKLNWKRNLGGQNVDAKMDNANSASPSPFTDGKYVWAMMSNGRLHCFDFKGNLIWQKELQKVYGEFQIQFGMSSTPILDKGRIYLQLIHGDMRDRSETSRGWIVALEAETGEEIWKHERITDGVAENKHAYTSPTLYRDSDRAFLITHGGDYATGHSLDDGSELWRCGGINPQGSAYNPFLRFVSSPVCAEGLIVIPSAKRGPVLGLAPGNLKGDVSDANDAHRWTRERGTPDVATPLIYQGRLYLAGEQGALTCIDTATGETIYEKGRFIAMRHRSTPVAADGKIYLTERDGTITVLKAGDDPKLLSQFETDENTTASPALSNGIVYVRTGKALYAFGSRTTANKKTEKNADQESDEAMKFAIAIHGGAGSSPENFSPEANEQRRASMREALTIGSEILKEGGTSLEAVEKVIVFLENDPQFNAGVGAVFNAADSHELDASIMDGNNLACGAVCGVSRVKNPISLARLVMTETPHVLLAAQGAEQFAEEQKVEMVSPSHFDTPATRKKWEKRKRELQKKGAMNDPDLTRKIAVLDEDTGSYLGTVGCVALDSHGNLAAATSTGGLTNKRYGRVGDSPIVGAGTYADNRTCAVSGTGIGEQYIRNAIAYDIGAQMLYKGSTLEAAVKDNLENRLDQGDGGIIAVDRDGNISMGFNTKGMARAAADSTGRFEILWGTSD